MHPAARPRRDLADSVGAAAADAGPRDDPVLGHLGTMRGWWNIEDLVAAFVEDRGVRQGAATSAAGVRVADQRLVRVLDPLERRAEGAVLFARTMPRMPLRGPLRCGLGERNVRGRRLRGARGVLAQLPLPNCATGPTSSSTRTACCATSAVSAAIVASFAGSRSSSSSRVGSLKDSAHTAYRSRTSEIQQPVTPAEQLPQDCRSSCVPQLSCRRPPVADGCIP